MNLKKGPSFTFERPDGTRQSFDYERARCDDLHLTPVSFDLFCRLEELPVFSAEMTALWISEREPLPELSMVIAGAHDPEELPKRQKFALFPMMLRLQALRDLRAHPSVQRFAASGPYRDLLEDPRLRHEFLSRHPLRDLEEAPLLCGWYPEELMEFLERTHRWGTHEICLDAGQNDLLLCGPTNGRPQEYLPMTTSHGKQVIRLSGEPQREGAPPVVSVTFLRRAAGEVTELQRSLIGTAGQIRWVVDLSSQGEEQG
ncbi:hypothetical protein ACFOHK_19780 [Falsigemmobacter intermedius]|uniref:Uncharacterized protein n=1 Tax=Falsigemmobacter intermedius TaxID=1553448 RepID=A0A3S3UBI2_9RHOB|nr:hypothetical protein [Falsigemmobacter intermedius]RWY38520.1 hypothetical protein EP867_15765 [Falsigemmobacter intermedius]